MKIISLNVERDKHLALAVPFFEREEADVLCLQEITKYAFDFIRERMGLEGFFAPMTIQEGDGSDEKQWGVAIVSRYPLFLLGVDMYDQFTKDYPEHNRPERPLATLLTVKAEGLTIGVTHFTWAPGGGVTEEQRVNLVELFKITDNYPSLILCGDFNAPRGTEIHNHLTEKFIDTVPASVESTLDPEIHRIRDKYVVDGIFVTNDISIDQETRVVSGVSDHCALVATVSAKV